MSTEVPIIRLVLADNHEVVRAGLRSTLQQRPHFQVIGEASSGEAALQLIQRGQPDVALIDLHMPPMGGKRLIETLRLSLPEVRLVVLSVHEEPERVQVLKAAGAHGYLFKSMSSSEIVDAVERVARGEACFPAHGPDETVDLSVREKEVAILIAKGFATRGIAELIGIGERTVDTYRSNIRYKWRVETTAEIVEQVRIRGLLED